MPPPPPPSAQITPGQPGPAADRLSVAQAYSVSPRGRSRVRIAGSTGRAEPHLAGAVDAIPVGAGARAARAELTEYTAAPVQSLAVVQAPWYERPGCTRRAERRRASRGCRCPRCCQGSCRSSRPEGSSGPRPERCKRDLAGGGAKRHAAVGVAGEQGVRPGGRPESHRRAARSRGRGNRADALLRAGAIRLTRGAAAGAAVEEAGDGRAAMPLPQTPQHSVYSAGRWSQRRAARSDRPDCRRCCCCRRCSSRRSRGSHSRTRPGGRRSEGRAGRRRQPAEGRDLKRGGAAGEGQARVRDGGGDAGLVANSHDLEVLHRDAGGERVGQRDGHEDAKVVPSGPRSAETAAVVPFAG